MEAANDDPTQMLVELAGKMTPERRGRFLDAACGDDATLRAEVETRLSRRPEPPKPEESAATETEADPFESMAMEALSAPDTPYELDAEALEAETPEDASLIDHCDHKRLDLVARLRVFEMACETVHDHHRRGMLYGGLSPEQVRVTPDGLVRIEPRKTSPIGPSTSPEQVLGEPLTTATDVYGLGYVLYVLLTGRQPYPTTSSDPDALYQAICEQAPERPSLAIARPEPAQPADQAVDHVARARGTTPGKLRRRLAGDLELVVLKALHKEPERRYGSADQLADDLERSLQGLPVRAHEDTEMYRLGKLIGRHPIASVLGSLLLAGMSIALVVTAISLPRVRRERDRSESAYDSAQSAIDGLFTRIHDGHAFDAPPLEPARAELLGGLLHHYENLINLRGDDPTARQTVARARWQIARIARVLGQNEAAAWQYEQAVSLHEELAARTDGSYRDQIALALCLKELGETLLRLPERRGELSAAFEHARALLESVMASHPESEEARRELALVLGHLAEIERAEGRLEESRAAWKQAIELDRALVDEHPHAIDVQAALASAHVGLGRALAESPESREEAMVALGTGIDQRQALVREHPERVDQVYQLALDLDELSSLAQSAGQIEPAITTATHALQHYQQLDRQYPGTIAYQTGLYTTLDRLSRLRSQQREPSAAMELAQQARGILENLVAEHPRQLIFQVDLARSHSLIGRLLRFQGKYDESLQSFQRSVDLLESLPRHEPAEQYELAANLALCISLIGSTPDTPPPDDEAKLSEGDRRRRVLYGNRAMEALQQAVSRGFGDLETMKDDDDLDALRGRPDFKALLKDMANEKVPGP
jgi:tetratricopeptide (TPR) repeat protein